MDSNGLAFPPLGETKTNWGDSVDPDSDRKAALRAKLRTTFIEKTEKSWDKVIPIHLDINILEEAAVGLVTKEKEAKDSALTIITEQQKRLDFLEELRHDAACTKQKTPLQPFSYVDLLQWVKDQFAHFATLLGTVIDTFDNIDYDKFVGAVELFNEDFAKKAKENDEAIRRETDRLLKRIICRHIHLGAGHTVTIKGDDGEENTISCQYRHILTLEEEEAAKKRRETEQAAKLAEQKCKFGDGCKHLPKNGGNGCIRKHPEQVVAAKKPKKTRAKKGPPETDKKGFQMV